MIQSRRVESDSKKNSLARPSVSLNASLCAQVCQEHPIGALMICLLRPESPFLCMDRRYLVRAQRWPPWWWRRV
jgi:hypothetical protein